MGIIGGHEAREVYVNLPLVRIFFTSLGKDIMLLKTVINIKSTPLASQKMNFIFQVSVVKSSMGHS